MAPVQRIGTVVLVFLFLTVSGLVAWSDTIHLVEVPDGRIYQRDRAYRYELRIEGTYTGVPTSIEAQVIQYGTEETVVPWTMIQESPAGGVFSGILADIPQGGWYALQVRFADNPACFVTGQNKFGVGVLIACTGQSHIDLWFEQYMTGPSDVGYEIPVADELTRM